MAQTYKDPTFDEVARREAKRLREKEIKSSRRYRIKRRRRIKRHLAEQMNRRWR